MLGRTVCVPHESDTEWWQNIISIDSATDSGDDWREHHTATNITMHIKLDMPGRPGSCDMCWCFVEAAINQIVMSIHERIHNFVRISTIHVCVTQLE